MSNEYVDSPANLKMGHTGRNSPSPLHRRTRVLFLDGCYDGTVGGSHSCLATLIMNLDSDRYEPLAAFYCEHMFSRKLREAGCETHIFEWPVPRQFISSPEAQSFVTRFSRLPLKLTQKVVNFWIAFLHPVVRHVAFIRKNGIDIVHVNNSINTNHDWMLAAKIAGVVLVSHERGMSPRVTRTARLMARLVDRFVCVSRMILKNLRNEGIPDAKLSLVYDGIDFRRFVVGRPAATVREEMGIAQHQPVFGILGNVREWKGQETVIRAAAILRERWPNLVCLIVGTVDNHDPYMRRLHRLVAELGLQNTVRFTGFQERPAEFLAMMDVVCHASIQPEPFGMVNLEAMYMNKAVVSTNIGGPVEVFTDGVNGLLIHPGNPSMLAKAVANLFGNTVLSNRLGEAARQHVISQFDAASTAVAIGEIYEELLESR